MRLANCIIAAIYGAAVVVVMPKISDARGDEPAAAKPGIVEHVAPKREKGDGLGTAFYSPSERESPFFKRLADDEVATGGLAGKYDIAKRDNKFVGWFGIVHTIREDVENDSTTLLVEQKYFDGLTDSHIMSLSFDGSGDFQAVLPGTSLGIRKLSLVKVYGTAKAFDGGAEGPKRAVAAEFVRNWDWGAFTFMFANEKQAGNPKWRKLNTVPLDQMYAPYPDDDYYERRLGKR